MMDNRQPPVEPGGDLELTNSETAARRFCLQYDCVRNCYWRPYDLQAEQTRHWESLCSAQENIYRKVDYTHEKICLSRQPNKTRGWISWRINHKGLSVQSVELLLSGIRTFSANAQVKPVLRCGDHSTWPVFVHSTDKHTRGTEGVGRLRVEGIGPADFTELRVSIEDGGTDWGQSQLFSAYNQASGKHGLYLMIRFTDTDEDEIIRADFNVEQMANRLMDNFTGNKYRKPDNTVAATGRGHQAAGNADAGAVEGERRPPRRAARAWDSDSDIDLGGDDWRLDDGREWDGYDAAAAFDNGGFGAAALANVGPDVRNFRPNNRNGRGGRAAENNGRVAAAGRGRRRPDRRHIVWGVDGDDDNFVDEEEQEDKRAAFAAEVLRELCSRTRRERLEVSRRVEQKLERGKRIVDLFSEALHLFGDRALLLEALFPPHYEDFCLVAINLLHFQLHVQPNRDCICPSVTRNQTELYTAGKFQWNLSPRPYYGINKNSGWSNIGQANVNRAEQWLGQGRPHNLNERTARNDGWNNDAIGLNDYLYGANANAREAVEEAAASLEVFLEDWGPLPFKFTCRSGNLQPENHMLEILVVRDVADGPGGEKQKMLKKFRLRPTQQDGKLILDGSKIQHQADIPSPMKEPFDLHEGVDCLVQIRVLESRRNFIDFKCGGKKDVATTSAAPIVAGPDNHPLVSGILNVDGIRLYVSKELLHLVSPFFFKLFTQEFAEKGLNEVQLHGLNAAEVEDFLLVVSSRLSAKPVHPNPQNMAALLELAEYFDVPFLTQELGHLFPVFAEIPMHIRLTLAVRYRLTEVKDSLIDSELGEESALLCQRLLLPKLGGQKERELVLDGYLQGKSNKAILKEMLASCM